MEERKFTVETSNSFVPIIFKAMLDNSFFDKLQNILLDTFRHNEWSVEDMESNLYFNNDEDFQMVKNLLLEKINKSISVFSSFDNIDLDKVNMTSIRFVNVGVVHFKLKN